MSPPVYRLYVELPTPMSTRPTHAMYIGETDSRHAAEEWVAAPPSELLATAQRGRLFTARYEDRTIIYNDSPLERITAFSRVIGVDRKNKPILAACIGEHFCSFNPRCRVEGRYIGIPSLVSQTKHMAYDRFTHIKRFGCSWDLAWEKCLIGETLLMLIGWANIDRKLLAKATLCVFDAFKPEPVAYCEWSDCLFGSRDMLASWISGDDRLEDAKAAMVKCSDILEVYEGAGGDDVNRSEEYLYVARNMLKLITSNNYQCGGYVANRLLRANVRLSSKRALVGTTVNSNTRAQADIVRSVVAFPELAFAALTSMSIRG